MITRQFLSRSDVQPGQRGNVAAYHSIQISIIITRQFLSRSDVQPGQRGNVAAYDDTNLN